MSLVDQVLQGAEIAAPMAADLSGNPSVAAALRLAPVAIQLLQSAIQLTQAGAFTNEQLATLWNQIGQGIQNSHNQWVAMNNGKIG